MAGGKRRRSARLVASPVASMKEPSDEEFCEAREPSDNEVMGSATKKTKAAARDVKRRTPGADAGDAASPAAPPPKRGRRGAAAREAGDGEGQRGMASKAKQRGQGKDGGGGQDDQQRQGEFSPQRTAPRKRGIKKRRDSSLKSPQVDLQSMSLFDVAQKSGRAVSVAARAWVQMYKKDRTTAMAQLLTLIVRASACTQDITNEEVEEGDMDSVVTTLAEYVKEHGGRDPFSGKGGRAFKNNYLELWSKIIKECNAAGLTYNEYMIERVCYLLIALSSSTVRPFRYGAILTAGQIVSGWISIMSAFMEATNTAQGQLVAERKKKQSPAVKQRIDGLHLTMERCHQRVNNIKDMINHLYQAMFSQRFRDIAPPIRAVVIEGIGDWVRRMPSTFMNDQYLKYIAWALSDGAGLVRAVAVSSLSSLYNDEDNTSHLHEFTMRFSRRFYELVYDKDEAVAVKGVQLLTRLVQLEALPPCSMKDLYSLLSDECVSLRQAAAQLVCEVLKKHGEGMTPAKAGTTEVQLAGLLSLLQTMASEKDGNQEVEEGNGTTSQARGSFECSPLSHHVIECLVETLFARTEMLQDWQLMIDWLGEDSGSQDLGDTSTTHLVMLLDCCMHMASREAAVGSRAGQRTARARKSAADRLRQDASLVMMRHIDSLIRRFQADATKVAALVGIIPCMKLELYSLKREEVAYKGLLCLTASVFFKHHDEAVLKQCVATLQHCCRNGPQELQDAARSVFNDCVSEVSSSLKSAADSVCRLSDKDLTRWQRRKRSEEARTVQRPDIAGVQIAATRLSCLLCKNSCSVASADSGFRTLSKVLEKLKTCSAVGPRVAEPILRSMLLWVMWGMARVKGGDETCVDGLLRERAMLVRQLEWAMGSEEVGQGARLLATQAFVDVCVMFSERRLGGTNMEVLAFQPADQALRRVWEICNERVDAARGSGEGAQEQESPEELASETDANNDDIKSMSIIGRLVAHDAISPNSWLASTFVAQMAEPHEGVAEVVRAVVRQAKRVNPALAPELYFGAMSHSFETVLEAHTDNEREAALEGFARLCHVIAQMFASFGFSTASRQGVISIVDKGVRHGLEDAPRRLEFLSAGLPPFVSRMSSRDAEDTLHMAERWAQAKGTDPGKEEWAPFFDFTDVLKGRVKQKKAVRGILKTKGGQRGPRQRASHSAPPSPPANADDADAGRSGSRPSHGRKARRTTRVSRVQWGDDEGPEREGGLAGDDAGAGDDRGDALMRELRAEEEEDSEDDQEPGTPAESGSEDELEANGQAVSPSFGGPGLDGHEASGASEESDDDLGEARESDEGQGVQHQTQNSMWAGAESEEEDDEEVDVIIDEQQYGHVDGEWGQEDDVVGTNQTLTPTEQELPTYGRVRHGRTPRSPEGSEEDVEPPPRLRRRRRG